MSQKLQISGIKFMNEKDIQKIDRDFIMNYDDGDRGYVLEVDLNYP